jgi:hypothetical protein
MPDELDPSPSRDQRVDEIIGAHLKAMDAGSSPATRNCRANWKPSSPTTTGSILIGPPLGTKVRYGRGGRSAPSLPVVHRGRRPRQVKRPFPLTHSLYLCTITVGHSGGR